MPFFFYVVVVVFVLFYRMKTIKVMNNNQGIVETTRMEYKIATIELNLVILISIERRD